MIILAHDGSIYGDWVANYALHFATNENDRKLLVIHVDDGETSPGIVATRLDNLKKTCEERGVTCSIQLIPGAGQVYRTIQHAIPPEPNSLLLCGTRLKPRRRRFLRGSIAESLLRMNLCPVLALRVVQPGRLGSPNDILFPLSGHLDTDMRAVPVLSRLAPSIRHLHLFRALIVNPLRHPYLTSSQEATMMEIGRAQIDAVQHQLAPLTEQAPFRIDRRICVADSWANEVLVQASRLKAELILVGIGHPDLGRRIFRGSRLERLLFETPCDVGIFKTP